MRRVARWSQAPWRSRPTGVTRLSKNIKTERFKRPGERVPPKGHGQIDYDKRLWQHSSGQKGIGGCVYRGRWFAYGLADEWQKVVLPHADWIEFQDRTTEPWTMYRISVARALRLGHAEDTIPKGWRWLVPLDAYVVVKVRASFAT